MAMVAKATAFRGATKTSRGLQRELASVTADGFVERMAADLEGRSAEFVVEVIRATARRLARWLVMRVGEGRCMGIFVGAITHACPSYRPDGETQGARAAAEALFAEPAA